MNEWIQIEINTETAANKQEKQLETGGFGLTIIIGRRPDAAPPRTVNT